MTLLGEKDNDTVTVDVNGILIDIDAVAVDRGCIVLILNPEDMADAVRRTASGAPTQPRSGE